MIHGTFPLAKFGFLLFKQITRPIHKKIVLNAKRNKILRKRLCIPLAKSFYKLDVRIRFFHEDWSKLKKVHITDEKSAIDTGAYIMAELITMLGIVIVIFYEYKDYSKCKLDLENKDYKDRMSLHENICRLEGCIDNQSKQLNELYLLFEQLQLCIYKEHQ